MVRSWLQQFEQELKTTLTRPGAQLTRGQRFLTLCIDMARHARRELRNHSATTMAAALTYRTIFGLVPMVVMALIVFRAFGGFAGSQDGLTDKVYGYLGITEDIAEVVEVQPGDFVAVGPQGVSEAASGGWLVRWYRATEQRLVQPVLAQQQAQDDQRHRANAEMRQRIDELIGSLAQGATSINFGGIGTVGMLLLTWAALGLVVTVEKTFNTIYDAPSGRPWHLRIPIYWAIITLGPVLVSGSFYLSTQLADATKDVWGLAFVFRMVNQLSALLVTWLLFLLLFTLLPNTKVAVKPAMAGAMVSALAWELMKAALRWYIQGAVIPESTARLYGSLALIPLMLFWVYLSWMVVLAGLEVAHILQTLPGYRIGNLGRYKPATDQPQTRDPRLVIPLMSAVAQAFDQGKPVGIAEIAERLDAPVFTVERVASGLAERGLLHRVNDGQDGERYTLAMPPGQIRIAELIAGDPDGADADRPGHALLMQLAKAQDAALADVTLAQRDEKM